MGQIVLKQQILEKIKTDPVLFGKVANAMDLQIRTLDNVIRSKPSRLAHAEVLKVLRDHLGIEQDSELLTELVEAD